MKIIIGPKKSNELLKAQVKTVPIFECNETYRNYNIKAKHIMFENGIQGSQYCASDPSGRNDSCHGDSGGPLQFFQIIRKQRILLASYQVAPDAVHCPPFAPELPIILIGSFLTFGQMVFELSIMIINNNYLGSLRLHSN